MNAKKMLAKIKGLTQVATSSAEAQNAQQQINVTERALMVADLSAVTTTDPEERQQRALMNAEKMSGELATTSARLLSGVSGLDQALTTVQARGNEVFAARKFVKDAVGAENAEMLAVIGGVFLFSPITLIPLALKTEEGQKQESRFAFALGVFVGSVAFYPISIVLGLGALAVSGGQALHGVYKGSSHLKEGEILLKKRNGIIQLLQKAMKLYNEGEYEQFIKTLAEPYYAGQALISLRRRGFEYQPIITELLNNTISPDITMQLLFIIAEVVLSGKIDKLLSKDSSKNIEDIQSIGRDIFWELATNQRFIQEALNIQKQLKVDSDKLEFKISLQISDATASVESMVNKVYELRLMARMNFCLLNAMIPSSTSAQQKVEDSLKIIKNDLAGIKRPSEALLERLGTLQDYLAVKYPEYANHEVFARFNESIKTYTYLQTTQIYDAATQAQKEVHQYLPITEDMLPFQLLNQVGDTSFQVSLDEFIGNLTEVYTKLHHVANVDSINMPGRFSQLRRAWLGTSEENVLTAAERAYLTPLFAKMFSFEDVQNIQDWEIAFRNNPRLFTSVYLPLLAWMYPIQFIAYLPNTRGKLAEAPEMSYRSDTEKKVKHTVHLVADMEKKADIQYYQAVIIFSTSKALHYLHQQLALLEQNPTLNARAILKYRLQLVKLHIEQAKVKQMSSQLNGLVYWSDALLAINALDTALNVEAIFLKARCLIALTHYKEALAWLVENKKIVQFDETAERNQYEEALTWFVEGEKIVQFDKIARRNQPVNMDDCAEYHLLMAKAQRLYITSGKCKQEQKQKHVKIAIAAIYRAEQHIDVKEYQTEKQLIDNLSSGFSLPKTAQLRKEEPYYHSRQEDQHAYHILSIDGGGIRGVIPAVWLNEIERRTHRPTAHLFHAMAGTSTGAIIAGGLAVPEEGSNYRPKYAAQELIEIYHQKGAQVFSGSVINLKYTFGAGPKYTVAGREKLFQHYFGEMKISQALTELIIPATKESEPNKTFWFTRHDAQDPTKNYYMSDIMMCTSAAPTYFDHHTINGFTYVDGGVQQNNPSQAAYLNARSLGIDSNKVKVLSLGTGDHVVDPRNESASRGWLFWAKNLHKYTFAQQGDADRALLVELGSDRYYRAQVFFEEPIGLDAHQRVGELIEAAQMQLEEMYADENNSFNKLLESIEPTIEPPPRRNANLAQVN